MRSELGSKYINDLIEVFENVLGQESDLCCYFFEKARGNIECANAKRAGLLATNSIRGGVNREVLQRIKRSGDIYMAWSDEPWILDGAAVRISIVGFDDGDDSDRILDGTPVDRINSDLTGTVDITTAVPLPENSQIAFQGVTPAGPFYLDEDVALGMLSLPANPNGRPNSDVVRPYYNAIDLTRRPRDVWIVDFGIEMPRKEAALYEAPFEWVRANVLPVRETNRRERYRELWWLHAEPRPGLRESIRNLDRYLATPLVSKHRLFRWVDSSVVPANLLVAFARDGDYFFGVLHSRAHEVWSLRMGTWLGKGNDPRYTPTTTFETFPFPRPTDEQREAIAAAAKRLNELRENWLNPPDASEADLKKRTLTNLYNARPTWLDQAHQALDRAVWDAYGWNEDPTETDDETILRRLLALNLERAAGAKA